MRVLDQTGGEKESTYCWIGIRGVCNERGMGGEIEKKVLVSDMEDWVDTEDKSDIEG